MTSQTRLGADKSAAGRSRISVLLRESGSDSLQNFAILEIGMVFIAFAATVHIYRVSAQVK